jgi:hypothetical protein
MPSSGLSDALVCFNAFIETSCSTSSPSEALNPMPAIIRLRRPYSAENTSIKFDSGKHSLLAWSISTAKSTLISFTSQYPIFLGVCPSTSIMLENTKVLEEKRNFCFIRSLNSSGLDIEIGFVWLCFFAVFTR